MIALEQVATRRAPLTLANVSLTWGPGLHAVVGGSGDGGTLILELLAGVARPRKGRVRVLDGAPTDADVRRQVAFVPLEPSLPDALRVAEVLAIAAAIRGEPGRAAAERLSALGVQALESRRIQTLSREEVRAVAIAEAATSEHVRVLLVEEPFVGLDPRAVTYLPGVLRARSREGCAVVIATASVRDAGELADDHVLMRGGAVVGQASSLDALSDFSLKGVRIRIFANDSRRLAAALALEEGVEAVARRDGSVVARGRNANELARAAGRGIIASGVELTEMRIEPPSLDEARAAIAGVAAATYKAAVERTRASLLASEIPVQDSGGEIQTTGQRGAP